jgi:hypothetical protein
MKAPAFNLDRPQPGEAVVWFDRQERAHYGTLLCIKKGKATVKHPTKGESSIPYDDVRRP